MVSISRRTLIALPLFAWAKDAQVNTVLGPVAASALGTTLIHEHVLVDVIGADKATPSRYDAEDVFRVALPKLEEVRKRGCKTLVECTPAFLGRDPRLLARLAKAAGMQLITNTGYYGAANDKHVPDFAYRETAEQLAARWTREWRSGIEGTGITPAFMKIGVDGGALSDIDRKLVQAGAICHKQTGLRLHVHTGNGAAALDILEVLATAKVPASAYVWVHAQSEKDREIHMRAAKAGAWLEFDGINAGSLERHVTAVKDLIAAGYRNQLLISHDSGWYRVGEPGGGKFNGYTYLFDAFAPKFTADEMNAMLVTNPARVLTIRG
jgi:predicted metal-dependent phosphotriesterase family hydrolase